MHHESGVSLRWNQAVTGLAVACLLAGFTVATVTTSLAIQAGEVPASLLPFGIATMGLAVLTAVRALVTLTLWRTVARYHPRYGDHALVLLGVAWLLWGTWQAWLLLART
ncbi:hypothetical protein [Natronomonas sp. EA1]|uniref:hypothetical protein n=1 Tax=Natronomonas sp. EA1 TaxID=3421655 RepID=UPI003EBBFDE5